MKKILESHYLWELCEDDKSVELCAFDGYCLSFEKGYEKHLYKYKKDKHCAAYEWSMRINSVFTTERNSDFLMYANPDTFIHFNFEYQQKRLIINYLEESIIYAESEVWESLYKVIHYDFHFKKQVCYYGILSKDKDSFHKLCDIQEEATYHICPNQRVVIKEKHHTIHIFRNGCEPCITFKDVESWYQVTWKKGNCTFCYSFYIFKIGDINIILNIRSMKYIALHFEKIVPTTFFKSNMFYKYLSDCKCIIDHSHEYLYVDNVLFDENLQVMDVLATCHASKPIPLDSHGYHTAMKDSEGNIHMFEFWPEHHGIRMREVPYLFFNSQPDCNGNILGYKVDWNIEPFDVEKERFTIDLDRLRDLMNSSSFDDDVDFSDWAGLKNALDEEWSAYWGEFD